MSCDRIGLTGLILLLTGILAFPESLAAQATTFGAILGRVVDPSGASVPNAAVKVINVETNVSRDANQDELLNFDEMPEALRDELARWDVTRDGLINIDEYKAYFAARAQQMVDPNAGGRLSLRDVEHMSGRRRSPADDGRRYDRHRD